MPTIEQLSVMRDTELDALGARCVGWRTVRSYCDEKGRQFFVHFHPVGDQNHAFELQEKACETSTIRYRNNLLEVCNIDPLAAPIIRDARLIDATARQRTIAAIATLLAAHDASTTED